MKILSERTVKGKRRLVVELEPSEDLLAIDQSQFYELGEPLHGDVVGGFVIANCARAVWCSVEQKWRSK